MAFHGMIQQLPSLQESSSFFNTSIVITLCVFFTLLCVCIVIGHFIEENRWANKSITALLLGLCAGVVVLLISKGKSSRILVFNENLFFLYLLPPIIFHAGFQVKKKQFFKNFNEDGFHTTGSIKSLEIEALKNIITQSVMQT